jgi:ComF family protein
MAEMNGMFRSLLGLMQAAFRMEGETCLICSAPLAAPDGHAMGRFLCGRCRETIPWIRPGDIRCHVCGRAEDCPDCPRRPDAAFVLNRSAVRYTAAMKEWLTRLKYRGDERLADMFAVMAAGTLERLMEERGLGPRDFACLVCVPLSEDRLAERGFNQTELIARRLADRSRIPYVPLLARTRHTGKMSQKTRAERLRHLEGAFACRDMADRERARIASLADRGRPLRMLLLDDVYTTGTTMQECARAIRATYPGAEVYGLTWAR